MLVQADQLCRDLKMVQQFTGVPRVLAGDNVHRPQNVQGAERDVLQVADRRSNKVKRSRHIENIANLREKWKKPGPFEARDFSLIREDSLRRAAGSVVGHANCRCCYRGYFDCFDCFDRRSS